jgi:hypothetical protein
MTNEKGKDNTLLNPLTSPINPQHPIVPTLEGGVEHRKGPPSSLSLSPLVISSSISTLNGNGTVPPPRPPRSPKRRLADISENEVVGQTDLKGVIANFVKRLEAVPPPSSPDHESPDSIYSTSTVPSTSTTHKRIRSLPAIVEMLEVDRSRSASGGTFGGELEMGMVQRASDDTEVVPHSDTLPATPLLPTSGGHSPISPLALTHPPPGISASSGNDKATPPNMPLPLPSLHVTRPSTSSTMPEPGPEAFSAVVEMMDRGDSPGRRRARGESPGPVEVVEEKQGYQVPREGRAQIPRRGMMGPGAILGKFPTYPRTAADIQPNLDPPNPSRQSGDRCLNPLSEIPDLHPLAKVIPVSGLHFFVPHHSRLPARLIQHDSLPRTIVVLMHLHHHLLISMGAWQELHPTSENRQSEDLLLGLERGKRWSRYLGSSGKN